MVSPSRRIASGALAPALLVFLGALVTPRQAHAQVDVQIKPYFLVILDTSGSMDQTTTCTSGTTNSCGWPCRRMNDAACVLRNVFDGVGEATFGLETFPLQCSTSFYDYGGGLRSHYTWPDSNFGCGTTPGGPAGAVQVPILDRNTAWLRSWVDGTWTGCGTTGSGSSTIYQGDVTGVWDTGAANHNIGAATSNTPLGGSLLVAQQYWQGPTSPIRTDPYRGCRPYYVLMLTDGEETCSGNPAAVAAALRNTWVDLNNNGRSDSGETFDIRTFAIGFGVSFVAGNGVEVIAQNGGTDAGSAGAPYAYYATNETELSAGINTIISQSILREVCNGRDDNCNGMVDEGYAVGTSCSVGIGTCERTGVNDCNAAGDGVACYAARRCSGGTCTPASPLTPGAAGVENTNMLCSDMLDNDCDGRVDCADAADCSSTPICSGACVPTGPEVCDGRDNDCDGAVDEDNPGGGTPCGSSVGTCTPGTLQCSAGRLVCTGGVGPAAEVCDGLDNNCNGAVDEGLTRACGSSIGACRPGVQQCIAGTWTTTCVGSIGPSTEVCDGVDNDCNGTIDDGNPGGGLPCGSNTGVCRNQTVCTSGALSCVTLVGPSAEVCDGLDNNCDGNVDEGLTRACGSSEGECRPGVQHCISGSYSGACVGSIGPTTEICDGLDNDCDGSVDEGDPGGGAACGTTGIGVCTAGVVHCVGGRLVCTGGTMPSTEICDGLDNDCNGVVDDAASGTGMPCEGGISFPTTPPVGACRLGVTVCRTGRILCEGAVGPAMELCNGIDDDCDGTIDDGLAGEPCGSSVGACRPGTLRCVMGRSICEGGVRPAMETCNGIDDDCDGEVDEGNPGGGGPCGESRGECVPGINVCRGGTLVCDGSRGPMPEVCNGLDDDCDGSIDEDLPPGGPCGTDEGECSAGTERCISGRLVCEGAVGPRPEECNCRDDDCNGIVDDMPTGSTPLCGEGSVCAGAPHCQCLRLCADGEFPCPVGRVCERVEGRNLCVGDLCLGIDCDDSSEVCDNGRCRPRCEGVTCTAPLVCDPRTGRCVDNGCRALENCRSGEICRDNRCQPDPCASVVCPQGQACYNGTCGRSCAGVRCPVGQSCFQGTCRDDRCAGVTCNTGETCDPANGTCVVDRCSNRRCGRDQTCDPLTGRCVDDPCAVVRCPMGQVCHAGSCDGPPDPPLQPRDRVIGSGGGASCAAGPAPAHETRGASALGALGAALLFIAGRRRARRGGEGA